MNGAFTRGVIFVHSAPRALCPHVEWAAGTVLGVRVALEWTVQPAADGLWRAEHSWVGPVGTGARLASALRGWTHLRYEITEDASPGCDGGRWSHTPGSGSSTRRRTRTATSSCRRTGCAPPSSTPATRSGCATSLDLALGQAWDDEARAVPVRRRRRAGALAAPGGLTIG